MAGLNDMLYDIKRISQHRVDLTDKKIKSIYEQLMIDLDAFLAEGYKKYADKDGRLYASYLDANRQKAAFLQQIVDNVDNITPQLKDQMQSLIDDTYEECYKGMSNSVKAAYGSSGVAELLDDIEVNPYVLQSSMNNNISKLTLSSVLENHRALITYQIMQELNIGLMNGDRYETMSKRIAERCKVSRSKAMNITRTETHRNVETGFMDCAEHLSEGLDGSGYIYAATWRTMGDERVRPQIRKKTKKGWITTWSKNGANHIKMEGVTVKVGEQFDLGEGIKAKCPSQSGYAKHDCNCRCFLEYNLMTVEEFKKATGKNVTTAGTVKTVRQAMTNNGIADLGLERTTNDSQFDIAIKKAKNANRNGACVDTHPKKELEDFKLFLSKDGMAGVAVKPDGDITAVFKNSDSNAKGAVNDLIATVSSWLILMSGADIQL